MENFSSEYILKVIFKNKLPFHLDTSAPITIGSDPRCDVILTDKKSTGPIATIEFINSALILKYVGPDQYLHFNGEYLGQGRNLFLTSGDEINVGGIRIQVLKNKEVQREEASLQIDDILNKPFVTDKEFDKKQKTNTNIKVNTIQKTKQKEVTKTTTKTLKKPLPKKVNPLVLNALRLYSIVIDFFVTYLLLSFLSFNEHLFRLSADISKFIFGLITTQSASAFLLFILNWLILNLFQHIIFGKTIGQFFAGLTFDYKNSVLNYLGKRILSFLFAFIFIPIQNRYNTTKVAFTLRILPLFLICGAIYYPKLAITPFDLTFSEESFSKTPKIEQSHEERFARNDNGDFTINIPNHYFFYPDFSKVKTQIVLKDLLENEELSFELVKSFERTAITEILTFNNPYAGLVRSFDEQKVFEGALHDSLKNISGIYDAALLKHKILLSADMKLKDFLFKDARSLKVVYPNGLTHLAQLEVDGQKMIMIVEETKVSLVSYQTNLPKLADTFLNALNDITPIPADNSKNITLIELVSTELNKDDQTILTYYINSVKNITENQRYYGKENLTVDISYLLQKSIESTMNLMSSQKIRASLKNLLTELTPMEKPGGNDE